MGTNSKLHVAVHRTATGATLGCNGDTFADTGYQATWEVTRGAERAPRASWSTTPAGTIGASFGTRHARVARQQFLRADRTGAARASREVERPGDVDFWPGNRGRRARTRTGRSGSTRFAGVERERSGNCHFAGEHTSIDFQGYLNGAVETGERAAAEILADLK